MINIVDSFYFGMYIDEELHGCDNVFFCQGEIFKRGVKGEFFIKFVSAYLAQVITPG